MSIEWESAVTDKYEETLITLDCLVKAIEEEIMSLEVNVPSLSEVYVEPLKRSSRRNQNRQIKALLKRLSRIRIEREMIYNLLNSHEE